MMPKTNFQWSGNDISKNLEISERASGNLPDRSCEIIFQNKY